MVSKKYAKKIKKDLTRVYVKICYFVLFSTLILEKDLQSVSFRGISELKIVIN